jgi:hypothetical protein
MKTELEPQPFETIELPFSHEHVCCVLCGVSLMEDGQYQDLHLCTTPGAALFSCSACAARVQQVTGALPMVITSLIAYEASMKQ